MRMHQIICPETFSKAANMSLNCSLFLRIANKIYQTSGSVVRVEGRQMRYTKCRKRLVEYVE